MIEFLESQLRRFVDLIGGITLLRLVLLVMALLSVEAGLTMTVEHILAYWLAPSVIFAILCGWLFGRSRLPGWLCGLAMLGIGVVWLVVSVGNMSSPIEIFLSSLPPILKMVIFRMPLDPGSLQQSWEMFAQGLGDLTSRLTLWLQYASTSALIMDPGITSLVWGLALWLVSAWAAWWLRRKEAVGVGLLPATALLIYTVYYTNSDYGIFWLAGVGGSWIVLQALDSYMKARRRWQEHHMGQAEIEPLLAGVMLFTAIGLMLAGSFIPSVSFTKLAENIQNTFKSRQDKTLAESLGLERTPELVSGEGVASIALSDTHAIGPGPQLSQEVMLYVAVDGYQPPPPSNLLPHTGLPQPEPRFYWRSQIFDSYNGHVWIANTALTQMILANNPYHPDLITSPGNYQVVRQHVERLQPMGGALFTAGELLDADQPSIAYWRAMGDLAYASTNAGIFSAESRIQSVTVQELRSAGNKYPESVQNYLNLPDELPDRVRDLAVRLTINQPSTYDKVMAIQNYLRQFPYSLQVPGAPVDREVADYFLFDLQEGYCDYFATTMAVMVRAVGIPSRLVVGFSSGTYDYDTHRFIVVRANAHAWVEVYFPGLGWVEFEPTSNLLPFSWPGETADQNKPIVGIPDRAPVKKTGAGLINWRLLRPLLLIPEFVLIGMVILLFVWLLLPLESWILYLRPADKAITLIHQRLYRLGRSWGVAANAARTPHEFANAFSIKLERVAGNKRLVPVIAALQTDVNWLTSLYTRLLFSLHPPTHDEHHQAVRNWAHIRKGLRKIRHS
jgi:hypothetical protein